jgi:hypothetical protein
MQLFGLGKKSQDDSSQTASTKAAKKPAADLKHQLNQLVKLAARYETTIVALAVALLLAITSLRMLHYMSPPVDDAKVQETLEKNKKIRIDQKTVEKLKQLQDNGAKPPAPTKTQTGRTNPFTE